MGMDVYGKSGNYFRATIWSWSPILHMVRLANDVYNLNLDTENWQHNDGKGLTSQEDCKKLANAMEALLEIEEPVVSAEHLSVATAFGQAMGMTLPAKAQASKEHIEEFIAFLREAGDGFNIY